MCRMLQIYSLCPFHEDGKKKPRNYFSSFRPYIHIRRCIFWHSLFSRFSPFVEGKTSSSPLGSSIKKSFCFVSHSSSFMSSKKKKKAMGLFVCAKLENQRDDIDLGMFIKTICSNFNGVKAAQVHKLLSTFSRWKTRPFQQQLLSDYVGISTKSVFVAMKRQTLTKQLEKASTKRESS